MADIHGMRSISVDEFEAFSSVQSPPREYDQEFDCFLAHDWGTEETNFDTHRRVLEIAARLSDNFKVWVDDESMQDNVGMQIVEALRNSKKKLVS